MKRAWLIAAVASACAAAALAAETKRKVIDVWPGAVPGETAPIPPETLEPSKPGTKPIKIMSNVSHPTLTVFPAPKEKNTGTAVVIAPGGGYNILAWDLEGTEVADWLNSIGVTGIVLKYRVPRRPGMPGDAQKGPLQDAQRAMSVVRSRAKEWNIDPNRIGMLGFSAGGHLAATAGTHYDAGDQQAADPVDRHSSRPDLLVLCYPVITFATAARHAGSMRNLLGEDPPRALRVAHSAERRVDAQTPPSFLWHTAADAGVPVENSLLFARALGRHGVPFELHVFPEGRHGLGLALDDPRVREWTGLCAAWLGERGFAIPRK